jgi:hypothetical protein
MKELTYRGILDAVYEPDDRDPIVQDLPEKDRLPKYGANSLKEPPRALRPDEAAAFDAIAMPERRDRAE